MNAPQALLIVPILLAISACDTRWEGEVIPPGSYHAENSDEHIVVTLSRIYFHVHASEANPQAFADREWNYELQPDGRIQPFPMRSVDAAFGVGRFNWFWKQGKIAKEDPKTGKTIWFGRLDGQSAAQPFRAWGVDHSSASYRIQPGNPGTVGTDARP